MASTYRAGKFDKTSLYQHLRKLCLGSKCWYWSLGRKPGNECIVLYLRKKERYIVRGSLEIAYLCLKKIHENTCCIKLREKYSKPKKTLDDDAKDG